MQVNIKVFNRIMIIGCRVQFLNYIINYISLKFSKINKSMEYNVNMCTYLYVYMFGNYHAQ